MKASISIEFSIRTVASRCADQKLDSTEYNGVTVQSAGAESADAREHSLRTELAQQFRLAKGIEQMKKDETQERGR